MRKLTPYSNEIEYELSISRIENAINKNRYDLLSNKLPFYSKDDLKSLFTIKKIIVSGPATIVFFNDNTKVVVKCSLEDQYSIYTAVAYAIAKRVYGSNSHYKKMVDNLTVRKNKQVQVYTYDELLDLFRNDD